VDETPLTAVKLLIVGRIGGWFKGCEKAQMTGNFDDMTVEQMKTSFIKKHNQTNSKIFQHPTPINKFNSPLATYTRMKMIRTGSFWEDTAQLSTEEEAFSIRIY
jgi:hypothetical protein